MSDNRAHVANEARLGREALNRWGDKPSSANAQQFMLSHAESLIEIAEGLASTTQPEAAPSPDAQTLTARERDWLLSMPAWTEEGRIDGQKIMGKFAEAQGRVSELEEALRKIADYSIVQFAGRNVDAYYAAFTDCKTVARAALAGRVEEQSSEGISEASRVGRSGGETDA